jgi:hypothetical protein
MHFLYKKYSVYDTTKHSIKENIQLLMFSCSYFFSLALGFENVYSTHVEAQRFASPHPSTHRCVCMGVTGKSNVTTVS